MHRIALVGPRPTDPDYALTIAAERANEAYWAGNYTASKRWNAIARYEQTKLEQAAR